MRFNFTFTFEVHDGDVFVAMEQAGTGWRTYITDFRSRPILDEKVRQRAIAESIKLLSSARGHLWHEELGHD
ncbi:MAG: hypothetical protein AAB368_14725 [bacterium]